MISGILTPKADLENTDTLLEHQAMVERSALAASGDGLATGHKKDLVLTPALYDRPGRVAIYGWHHPDGKPIQPVSLWHGERYVDYSHGVRLVARTMAIDGLPVDILDVLANPELAPLISDEGPLQVALLDGWR